MGQKVILPGSREFTFPVSTPMRQPYDIPIGHILDRKGRRIARPDASPGGIARPVRRVLAIPLTATFDTIAITAPTVSGTAASQVATDTVGNLFGHFVQLTNTTAAGNIAGIALPTLTQRRLLPRVRLTFRTALLNSFVNFFIGSADPGAAATHGTYTRDLSAVKGVGFFYDQQVANASSASGLVAVAGAPTNTYTRSDGGSFITDGWRVGRHPTWQFFANGANNGVKTITTLTATVMTVAEALVTEGTGASVTAGVDNQAQWRAVSSTTAVQTENLLTTPANANSHIELEVECISSGTNTSTWQFRIYDAVADEWVDELELVVASLSSNWNASDNLNAYVEIVQLAIPVNTARATSIKELVLVQQ